MSRPTILLALAGAALLGAWVGGLLAVLPDPPTHGALEPAHPVARGGSTPATGRAPEPVPHCTDPAIFARHVATLCVVLPDGLTDTTTVKVTGTRGDAITVRLSCWPGCAFAGITR